MNAIDFLQEIDESYFPKRLGHELGIESHDPPFRKKDLRDMAKQGLIVLNESDWTYRLTLAATDKLQSLRSTTTEE
jgi:Xaa-Pro aminopeptidase